MKERFKDAFGSFFISVTLINIAMLILGLMFEPESKFGYEVFLYPLIYGLIGMIPGLFLETNRELSIRQVLIRKTVELLLLIVLLLAFMFGGRTMDWEMVTVAAGVAFSIIVIYVMVHVIEWMLDVRTAKSMTEGLVEFQQRAEQMRIRNSSISHEGIHE